MEKNRRGRLDNAGWVHEQIPVANCIKCNHSIYRDEQYERRGFTDASGNNDREYWHITCPDHNMSVEKITVRKRCNDCGAIHYEDFRGPN